MKEKKIKTNVIYAESHRPFFNLIIETIPDNDMERAKLKKC